ncbi:putative U3 small nucleolar RNA-associated protein 12 [Blattamonas nauphoetae]|uniref:U3 small nucleolar RNA-associated protein 12 n=1 Tax=Blattamonas nauphoetae TaxID=2049346 RepID=A0ABQ9Y434_9EUKA|nr:putative U3 small nucleolar RNA-associated protein 12 [Blattamonas nauphoetae]
MVKAYLRYQHRGFHGITTSNGNVVSTKTGEYTFAVALENVIVWNTKLSKQVLILGGKSDFRAEVLTLSPDEQFCSVGYSNGSVRLFQIPSQLDAVNTSHLATTHLDFSNSQESGGILPPLLLPQFTFSGHTAPVTFMCFNSSSTQLLTGSDDTDVVLWDTVGERGIVRYTGHLAPITSALFIEDYRLVVTSAKDGLIKLWDLDTHHCIQTVMGDGKEIWRLAIDPTKSFLIAGGVGEDLRVYSITSPNTSTTDTASKPVQSGNDHLKSSGQDWGNSTILVNVLRHIGNLSVPSVRLGRIVDLAFSSDLEGCLFAICGKKNKIALYQMRTIKDAMKHIKRREKRLQEKIEGWDDLNEPSKPADQQAQPTPTSVLLSQILPSDLFIFQSTLTLSTSPASISFSALPGSQKHFQLTVGLASNSFNLYKVPRTPISGQQSTLTLLRAIRGVGFASHATPIVGTCLSSNSSLLVSISSSAILVTNTKTQTPIRSFSLAPAIEAKLLPDGSIPTCCVLVPGDRYVVIGTNTGFLALFDISTAELVDCIRDRGKRSDGATTTKVINVGEQAAEAGEAVWSVVLNAEGTGLLSGGGGNEVNEWMFELVSKHPSDSKQSKSDNTSTRTGPLTLSLTHTRTLLLNSDVLGLAVSPDGMMIACGLLDATVQLFYFDTLKYAFTCYGHSLPVTALSFSPDSTLLYTGSADKDVRVWSGKRGDLRGRMRGHAGQVTSLTALKGTHYFLTSSRDGTVKMWDGDLFHCAQTFDGTRGTDGAGTRGLMSVSTSDDGGLVMCGGRERCIRVWERSSEQIFVGEDEEEEQDRAADEEEVERVVEMLKTTNKGMAERGSLESVRGAEALVEAIEAEEKLFINQQNKSETDTATTEQQKRIAEVRKLMGEVITEPSSVFDGDDDDDEEPGMFSDPSLAAMVGQDDFDEGMLVDSDEDKPQKKGKKKGSKKKKEMLIDEEEDEGDSDEEAANLLLYGSTLPPATEHEESDSEEEGNEDGESEEEKPLPDNISAVATHLPPSMDPNPLLSCLRSIPSTALPAALAALPFVYSVRMLRLLPKYSKHSTLIHRTTHMLISLHQGELVKSMNAQQHSSIVATVGETVMQQLTQERDILAFNLAGLSLLQRKIDDDATKFFDAETVLARTGKKKRSKR